MNPSAGLVVGWQGATSALKEVLRCLALASEQNPSWGNMTTAPPFKGSSNGSYAHRHTHTYVHTFRHARMHTHTHTHTHTPHILHTHTPTRAHNTRAHTHTHTPNDCMLTQDRQGGASILEIHEMLCLNMKIEGGLIVVQTWVRV